MSLVETTTRMLTRIHKILFGSHNGDLARQYAAAARAMAWEGREFREELKRFRETSADPLADLLKIRISKQRTQRRD